MFGISGIFQILKVYNFLFYFISSCVIIFFFLHSWVFGTSGAEKNKLKKRNIMPKSLKCLKAHCFFFLCYCHLLISPLLFFTGVWNQWQKKCSYNSFVDFSSSLCSKFVLFLFFFLTFSQWVFWTVGTDCVGMAWHGRLLE